MAISVKIKEQIFLNQFNNGTDLDLSTNVNTNFLVGNCSELLKTDITIQVSWKAESDATDIFSYNTNTLTRSGSGSFITEGFNLGESIDIWEVSGTPSAIVSDRIITFISADTIVFDGASAGLGTLTDGVVYGKTPLESLFFNYGLIENNETINFISKIDGFTNNEFYADGIGVDTGGGVRSTSVIPMLEAIGVNSWKDGGNAKVNFNQTLGQSQDFAQEFIVQHTFRLLPYFLDGWLPNLNTLAPPFPEYQSTNCLKYVSGFEFREDLVNPNNTKTGTSANVQGNTGWFDENFNGLINNYSVTSVNIIDSLTTNPLSALDFQKTNKVTIEVESVNGSWTSGKERFSVGVSSLPDVNSYQQNQNTIAENFLFDYAIQEEGDPAINGVNNIIKNFDIIATTGTTATLEFEIEYTNAQQSLLSNQSYIIFVGCNDLTQIGISSDRVMLLADVKSYLFTNDVFDLMFMDEFKFVPHDLSDTDLNLYNDYKGWVEDGFQIQAPFKLNVDLGASLSSLTLDIVAYNDQSEELFVLQSTIIDLSGAVISSGIQQINVNNTNNFKLDANSDFKKIVCSNTGASTEGIYIVELYESLIGVRFNFEEWIPLLNANTIYFNSAQLNNGLNLLSSNYSTTYSLPLADAFDLRARLNAQVSDGSSTTNYQFLSNKLESYFYDLDDNDPVHWYGKIETFDVDDNLINLIYDNENVRIKATFNKLVGKEAPPDLVDPWGWIRIDIQQGSINSPFQLSTINDNLTPSALQPLATETKCKITNLGSSVILECLTDFSNLPSGSILSVSARISDENTAIFSTWKIQECGEGTPQVYYTLTDLSAYVGQVVLFENAECWLVVGADTKAPNVPFSTIVNDSFENCNDCGDGIKKMDGTSPVGSIIKTTESGNIKTLE